MTEDVAKTYLIALDAMKRVGPKDIHRKAMLEAEDLGYEVVPSDTALRDHLLSAHPDDELRSNLHLQLVTWDTARTEDSEWAEGTAPNTDERRDVILRRLKVDDQTAVLFHQIFPVVHSGETIVIADNWDQWYTPEVQQKHNFYWEHYENYLVKQRGWNPNAVAKLDDATTHVVERLTNPVNKRPYQAKGLVVGYVQSGKTANFTGVIAKAIDAGYRLVIVLTGTTNLLREQTQRRLDMELVGEENILRGVDIANPEALADVDYQQDEDWAKGKFVKHGRRPSTVGRPDIHRMTTRRADYRSLHQGIAALDFERRDRTKPLTHPDNLFASDARLVVVKKNQSALKKFVKDLAAITAELHEIPALIIDDESDQASVNTKKPSKEWEQGRGKRDRTAINALISQLLRMLPRGQYVGYTATPFANVFVDPSDSEDIFPRDFVISLGRPLSYMGPEDFHDIDSPIPPEERTIANSKERAHIRLLQEDDDNAELLKAMDTFVLAGAVKLFRREFGVGEFKHHTMLVHEAMKTEAHRAKAETIKTTWRTAGYFSSSCHPRLRHIYLNDILPVTRATAPELPVPATFEELARYLGNTAQLIGGNGNPVLVVNSDQDIEQEELNFEQHGVWRILVGGNKLARGFTIEGLTVSYYRREVKAADALMQMGRWFGYRDGYRDLVRLHVTPNLRDAFESICRDEEDFRAELRQYVGFGADGQPLVTPAQIPPLVSSRMVRPTAASKMYNAELAERRTLKKEPSSGYPALSDKAALERNIDACVPLLQAALAERRTMTCGKSEFEAFFGTVSHEDLVQVLQALRWAHDHTFAPDIEWLRGLGPDRITSWRILLPQQKSGHTASFRGLGPFSLHGRAHDGPDKDRLRGNSTSVHRNAVEEAMREDDPLIGWLTLYPVVYKNRLSIPADDPNEVVMAIRLDLPGTAAPVDKRPLAYRVRDKTKPDYMVVTG
jgi:hypothetical protein